MKKSLILTISFFALSLLNLIAQPENNNGASSSKEKIKTKDKKEDTAVINEILFSIGTNLNFVNSSQTSGLYYDINVFVPSLDMKKGRFGIDARLNQGKLIPNVDTSANRIRYFSTQSFDNQDTIDVLKQTYNTLSSEDLSHLTLSLSPTYRLGNQSFIFLAAHFEYRKIDRESKLEYMIEDDTTLRFTESSLGSINLSPVSILNRDYKSKSVQHNFNYGLGAKLFIELGSATLNIKSILGYGNKGTSEGLFYFTHFEVIENKLGIKVGGELRGIVNVKDGTRNRDFDPDIGLYIAKSFKLSKVSSLLKLSGTD